MQARFNGAFGNLENLRHLRHREFFFVTKRKQQAEWGWQLIEHLAEGAEQRLAVKAQFYVGGLQWLAVERGELACFVGLVAVAVAQKIVGDGEEVGSLCYC